MSSFAGPSIAGKRRRSTSMISFVSSTESVVCVMYASGRAGGERDALRVGDRLDEHDRVRRLAGRALHLLVAGVADEHDRVAALGEPARLRVHLRHERARRVDRRESARGCSVAHRGSDAVRGEDDGRPFGHVVDRVDEDRAALPRARARRASCGRSACARRRASRTARARARLSRRPARHPRSSPAERPGGPASPPRGPG